MRRKNVCPHRCAVHTAALFRRMRDRVSLRPHAKKLSACRYCFLFCCVSYVVRTLPVLSVYTVYYTLYINTVIYRLSAHVSCWLPCRPLYWDRARHAVIAQSPVLQEFHLLPVLPQLMPPLAPNKRSSGFVAPVPRLSKKPMGKLQISWRLRSMSRL